MSDSDSDERPPPPQSKQEIEDIPALFWDELPPNAEEHPDYAAIQALQDEATPEERAESYKIQGNNKLKLGIKVKNKFLLREAVEFYDKGLKEKCGNTSLTAILHCNRAQVHLLLGNWRNALEDSLDALKLDPGSVKAYFRGAKAAIHLKDYARCQSLCDQGQQQDPASKEFQDLLKEMRKRQESDEQSRQQQEARKEAVLAPARKLAEAITSRGYRVTRPQVRLADKDKPSVGEDGLMYWPVALMYPEVGSQDSIQAFCEEDTIGDHLDVMFGPDAPPLEWDEQHEYNRDRIELYYLSNAGTPLSQQQLVDAMRNQWPDGFSDSAPMRYGDKAAVWKRVKESHTLKQVLLQPDMVIPGIPLFFVIAKGTQYRDRFLAQEVSRS